MLMIMIILVILVMTVTVRNVPLTFISVSNALQHIWRKTTAYHLVLMAMLSPHRQIWCVRNVTFHALYASTKRGMRRILIIIARLVNNFIILCFRIFTLAAKHAKLESFRTTIFLFIPLLILSGLDKPIMQRAKNVMLRN